jgi:hypothetical protein
MEAGLPGQPRPNGHKVMSADVKLTGNITMDSNPDMTCK